MKGYVIKKWTAFKLYCKEHTFPLLIELLKWKIIDFRRLLKTGKTCHLYGIWLVCGLYGMGKTMYLTYYLEKMRKKWGDQVYIATNYFYSGQDFPLESWEDLLKEYDKPIIFGYDEIQNEFNSRDYQKFPVELLTLLTQNRKGKGKMIIGTAQRYGRVDKVFRELCSHVVEVKTRFGRLTRAKSYHHMDYEQLICTTEVQKKMKIHPMRSETFVQSDYLRNRYDSYQMLASARNKSYITKEEKVNKDMRDYFRSLP